MHAPMTPALELLDANTPLSAVMMVNLALQIPATRTPEPAVTLQWTAPYAILPHHVIKAQTHAILMLAILPQDHAYRTQSIVMMEMPAPQILAPPLAESLLANTLPLVVMTMTFAQLTPAMPPLVASTPKWIVMTATLAPLIHAIKEIAPIPKLACHPLIGAILPTVTHCSEFRLTMWSADQPAHASAMHTTDANVD